MPQSSYLADMFQRNPLRFWVHALFLGMLTLGLSQPLVAARPSSSPAVTAGTHSPAAKGKGCKKQRARLLAPSLKCFVAILPQERLFGNDSLTFLHGQYQTVVTTLPTRLYRAFGGVAMAGGSFVTPDSVGDTNATRKDLAILMAWGNTLAFEAVIKVPVATKLNVGRAAPQGDLPGGGEQVIMPFKWNVEWIERVYSTRSSESWTLAEFRAAYPQYFPTK